MRPAEVAGSGVKVSGLWEDEAEIEVELSRFYVTLDEPSHEVAILTRPRPLCVKPERAVTGMPCEHQAAILGLGIEESNVFMGPEADALTTSRGDVEDAVFDQFDRRDYANHLRAILRVRRWFGGR